MSQIFAGEDGPDSTSRFGIPQLKVAEQARVRLVRPEDLNQQHIATMSAETTNGFVKMGVARVEEVADHNQGSARWMPLGDPPSHRAKVARFVSRRPSV
jgi:hypothetical protein